MKLHELQYTEGARKARKRVGRGTSSGNYSRLKVPDRTITSAEAVDMVQEMVKQQVEVKKVKELDLVEVKNQDSKVDKLHYSCVYLKEDLQTILVKNMLS